MPDTPDRFAHLIDDWKEMLSVPWIDLHHSISPHNIARHLGKPPLRVLDVGGGHGVNSIHYAKQGHSVTLFDCSPAMLEEARKSAEEEGVADQLTFLEGDADAIQELLRGQQFGLIICHLMIEMVADANALLRNMCNILTPGGFLSVLDVNRYSHAFVEAFINKNLEDAIDAVGVKEYYHRWVDREAPRFSAEEIIEQLEPNGCTLAGQYGISCVNHWLPNEPKSDPEYFAELVRLEHRLTDTYPYYLLARFYQVIAEKG
ncbi:methyltransferase domain-containing protein [Candidatus Hydrogenedentota bacterium]